MQPQTQAQKAPQQRPSPHRENEIQTRRFRLPIPESRRAALAYDMAHITREIDHNRQEKASEMKIFNDCIKELEGRLLRVAENVEKGQEDQDIECVVEPDFDTNAIRFRRVPAGNGKPGEILQERAMTADERARAAQGNLPLDGIQVQPVDLEPTGKPEPTRIEAAEPDAEETKEKCSDCGHPWERKDDAGLLIHGHKKNGKCYVTDCNCKAFMP